MTPSPMLRHGIAAIACLVLAVSTAAAAPDPFPELVDPNPAPGNQFGASVVVLPDGNIAVTAPGDDFAATNAGAVYLYDGATGALLTTLRGSSAGDQVGSGGVVGLPGSVFFLVLSPNWDNGAVANAGAVTSVFSAPSPATTVGTSNSLVGSGAGDAVGTAGSVRLLASGAYLVTTPLWDNGAAVDAGAVTWVRVNIPVFGAISPANSLVGSTADDFVGNSVLALPNGNYVVSSWSWSNGAADEAGAVTWGSGTSGVSGVVSSANSLVGSHAFDRIGDNIRLLTNGNVVTFSSAWDNGNVVDAGAATFIPAATGRAGVVSSVNSLVGSQANDRVGDAVTPLTNGNYVVLSRSWNRSGISEAGAATWANGASGIAGPVIVGNSLVGASTGDMFAALVTPLTNGNYVVAAPSWNNGAVEDVGAVTWGNGSTGTTGVVQAANSVIGSSTADVVGSGGIAALPSGNYVIRSIQWNNGAVPLAGAVTWASGTAPTSLVVGSGNSLVGATPVAQIGVNFTVLTNGNFVMSSWNWDSPTVSHAGAVTWGSGTAPTTGVVSAANSLIGTNADDGFGFAITPLTNGHYVVSCAPWDDGAAADVGAVTWCNGTTGRTGALSAATSLIGTSPGDRVGSVTALPNGNYVVAASNWDNGAITDAGAVTWCSGTSGRTGIVSPANSLVGSTLNDRVGSGSIRTLPSGHFLVGSPLWNNGTLTDAGALTWVNGTAGISGPITNFNSLLGAAPSAGIGPSVALPDGDYLSLQPAWPNGTAADAGSATWGDGAFGVVGQVTTANSIVGWSANTGMTLAAIDTANHRFVLRFPTEGNGRVRMGPVSAFAFQDTGDLQGDDGGWVAISIRRWALDHAMCSLPVTQYGVWRRVVPTLAADIVARPSEADVARVRAVLPEGVSAADVGGSLVVTAGPRPAESAVAFPPGSWILVATVPALQQDVYDVAVPTPADGVPHDYVITAHTTTPANWTIVGPVAAQSANDRAPEKPTGLVAAYASGQTTLQWNSNSEADLSRYELHRDVAEDFTPSPATLIASSPLTSAVDVGPPGRTYKLCAVDVAGNASVYAVVTPGMTLGADPAPPVAFGLDPVWPNPVRGGALRVTFGLPRASAARLELLDVSGRRVVTRDVGALGAGRHSVSLADERGIAAGLYWLRLSAGGEMATRRIVIAK